MYIIAFTSWSPGPSFHKLVAWSGSLLCKAGLEVSKTKDLWRSSNAREQVRIANKPWLYARSFRSRPEHFHIYPTFKATMNLIHENPVYPKESLSMAVFESIMPTFYPFITSPAPRYRPSIKASCPSFLPAELPGFWGSPRWVPRA